MGCHHHKKGKVGKAVRELSVSVPFTGLWTVPLPVSMGKNAFASFPVWYLLNRLLW